MVSNIQRPNIHDYDLIRSTQGTEPPNVDFTDPILNPNGDERVFEAANWQNFTIKFRRNGGLVACYHLSIPLGAYITTFITLTYNEQIGSSRYTEMRYRDMIVDNYLDAGGELRDLQYLGYHSIENTPARTTIKRAFESAGMTFRTPGTVEIRPSNPIYNSTVDGNPFLRGIQSLLRTYQEATGNAKIKRILFTSDGLDEWDEEDEITPRLHMLIELTR